MGTSAVSRTQQILGPCAYGSQRSVALERQMRAASARVHLRWRDQLGEARFAMLWSALQEVTGRDDPLPDPAELRSAGG